MKVGVPLRILAAAGLAAAALVAVVAREGVARAQGQDVKLEIAGYDPRSLLTGHYVQFQLRSDLPANAACPPGGGPDDLTADGWVALKRQGDRHVAAGAARTRTEARKLGEVTARGGLTCFQAPAASAPGGTAPSQEVTAVMLDLGVDRLHLDQAQAEALEGDLRDPGRARDAHVVLSIGRDGKARVKAIEVNGRRADLDWS